ncbi:hypothetical protein ACYU03_15330 [Pseudomonas sp. X10]
MKPLSLLLLSAGLIGALPVCATDRTAIITPWPQEPSTFLGVDLHGDFLEQVKECPAGVAKLEKICREITAAPDQHVIRGLPYLPIPPGYSLVAKLQQGRIEQLLFTGNASSLYLVTDMLTERYGQPAEQTSHWIKMKSGASYLNEVLTWKGEKVTINFQRIDDDLGKYAVTFSRSADTATPAVETATVPTRETDEPKL